MLAPITISPEQLAIRRELDKAESSRNVHLSYKRLSIFPDLIFSSPCVSKIRRLDLGHNNISILPSSIYLLSDLRELWLQHNPIEEVPKDIEMCTRLEVMDLKGTRLKNLPPAISTLSKLHELDWCDTPFADTARKKFKVSVHDLKGLKRTMTLIFNRNNLEEKLIEYLLEHHFARETDEPENIPIIKAFAKTLSAAFDDNDEFKLFVRRAEKLIPDKLAMLNENTLPQAKIKFRNLNEETQRNRLSADVEIKVCWGRYRPILHRSHANVCLIVHMNGPQLRQVYFDMIERHQVDTLLADIYKSILSLQDMEFFIKYIVQVSYWASRQMLMRLWSYCSTHLTALVCSDIASLSGGSDRSGGVGGGAEAAGRAHCEERGETMLIVWLESCGVSALCSVTAGSHQEPVRGYAADVPRAASW